MCRECVAISTRRRDALTPRIDSPPHKTFDCALGKRGNSPISRWNPQVGRPECTLDLVLPASIGAQYGSFNQEIPLAPRVCRRRKLPRPPPTCLPLRRHLCNDTQVGPMATKFSELAICGKTRNISLNCAGEPCDTNDELDEWRVSWESRRHRRTRGMPRRETARCLRTPSSKRDQPPERTAAREQGEVLPLAQKRDSPRALSRSLSLSSKGEIFNISPSERVRSETPKELPTRERERGERRGGSPRYCVSVAHIKMCARLCVHTHFLASIRRPSTPLP